MNELLDELEILLRARTTLFWLASWEEQRVVGGLQQLAERVGRPVYSWSSARGFMPPLSPKDPPIREPGEALERISQLEGPGLFVLKDFHPWLEDPRTVRLLRELEETGYARERGIFIVSPVLALPAEIEKSVAVFDVPLPDLPHVTNLLAVLATTQSLTIDVVLFEQFVKAALGLTEDEIKRVFMRVLAEGNGFSESDLALIIEEKRKLIRRHRFLEYLPREAGLDHVGGLDQLKEWLVQRREAFTERARSFGLRECTAVGRLQRILDRSIGLRRWNMGVWGGGR